jgi:hypothetical protein
VALLFVSVYTDIVDIETFKKIVKVEELERRGYSEIKYIQKIDALNLYFLDISYSLLRSLFSKGVR